MDRITSGSTVLIPIEIIVRLGMIQVGAYNNDQTSLSKTSKDVRNCGRENEDNTAWIGICQVFLEHENQD